MFNILSFLLRYIFITIIYLFIFGIIRMIYLDISRLDMPAQSILPTKHPYLLVLNRRRVLHYDTKEFYPLNKDVIWIGRSLECDISFNDMLLSHKHIKIWFSDKEWRIQDLDSKNGTYLNDEFMEDVFLLDDGDVIRMGQLELQFCLNK